MAFSFKKIFSGLEKAKDVGPLSTVGIDIGGASVKVVELGELEGSIVLRTYGELQLGPYEGKSLGDVVTLSAQHQVEAVTDVLRESGVKSRRGTLAMPLSSSFLTVISLPTTTGKDDDLSTRIPVEARKYVPLPLNEVTLDWTELGSSKEQGITEIMLAAVENRALENYRSLMSMIGMTAQPSEIEAFSLMRSLWNEGSKITAIIDLGARSAKLYLVREGTLERLHRVGQGSGQEITRRVSELLTIPFEEAENLKRSYDREQEPGVQIYKTVSTAVDVPLSEFKRYIEQYESRIGSAVDRIVLTGGVSAGPYMLDIAQDRLGRPLELANPFAKVAYPAFLEDTLKLIGPSFGVALGAALRGF